MGAVSLKGSLLLMAFFIHTVLSAPVVDESTALIGPDQIAEGSGCYYNYEHYYEGDRILTNEPCLNCTCHNRMLMCYLRVCPFTKAIGQDCKVEKKPDQCCPVITCPQVPVALLTSSTTETASTTTALGHPDNFGCVLQDNTFYADGAQVPSDPRKPCELCYCIRNQTACVMQECTLNVEGCKPVYQEGVCCPVRYDCDYEVPTTARPTMGLITTAEGPTECIVDDQIYQDGKMILTTDNPCKHCYCMRGKVICAVQECGAPLENTDCTPMPTEPHQCCPTTYQCPNGTVPAHYVQSTPNMDADSHIVTGHTIEDEKITEVDTKHTVEEEIETTEKSTETSSEASTDPFVDIVTTAGPHSEEPEHVSDNFETEVEGSSEESHNELSADEETSAVQDPVAESTVEQDSSEESEEHGQSEPDRSESHTADLEATTAAGHYTEISVENVEMNTSPPEVNPPEQTIEHRPQDEVEPTSEEETPVFTPAVPTTQDESQEADREVQGSPIPEEPPVSQVSEELVSQETEAPTVDESIGPVETTPAPNTSPSSSFETVPEEQSRIPGEGSCLHKGITYAPNTEVPSSNHCKRCRCVNSIVSCSELECPEPPIPLYSNCVPMPPTDGACCPTYFCEQKPSPEPEAQNHVSIDKIDETVPEEEVAFENVPTTGATIAEETDRETPESSEGGVTHQETSDNHVLEETANSEPAVSSDHSVTEEEVGPVSADGYGMTLEGHDDTSHEEEPTTEKQKETSPSGLEITSTESHTSIQEHEVTELTIQEVSETDKPQEHGVTATATEVPQYSQAPTDTTEPSSDMGTGINIDSTEASVEGTQEAASHDDRPLHMSHTEVDSTQDEPETHDSETVPEDPLTAGDITIPSDPEETETGTTGTPEVESMPATSEEPSFTQVSTTEGLPEHSGSPVDTEPIASVGPPVLFPDISHQGAPIDITGPAGITQGSPSSERFGETGSSVQESSQTDRSHSEDSQVTTERPEQTDETSNEVAESVGTSDNQIVESSQPHESVSGTEAPKNHHYAETVPSADVEGVTATESSLPNLVLETVEDPAKNQDQTETHSDPQEEITEEEQSEPTGTTVRGTAVHEEHSETAGPIVTHGELPTSTESSVVSENIVYKESEHPQTELESEKAVTQVPEDDEVVTHIDKAPVAPEAANQVVTSENVNAIDEASSLDQQEHENIPTGIEQTDEIPEIEEHVTSLVPDETGVSEHEDPASHNPYKVVSPHEELVENAPELTPNHIESVQPTQDHTAEVEPTYSQEATSEEHSESTERESIVSHMNSSPQPDDPTETTPKSDQEIHQTQYAQTDQEDTEQRITETGTEHLASPTQELETLTDQKLHQNGHVQTNQEETEIGTTETGTEDLTSPTQELETLTDQESSEAPTSSSDASVTEKITSPAEIPAKAETVTEPEEESQPGTSETSSPVSGHSDSDLETESDQHAESSSAQPTTPETEITETTIVQHPSDPTGLVSSESAYEATSESEITSNQPSESDQPSASETSPELNPEADQTSEVLPSRQTVQDTSPEWTSEQETLSSAHPTEIVSPSEATSEPTNPSEEPSVVYGAASDSESSPKPVSITEETSSHPSTETGAPTELSVGSEKISEPTTSIEHETGLSTEIITSSELPGSSEVLPSEHLTEVDTYSKLPSTLEGHTEQEMTPEQPTVSETSEAASESPTEEQPTEVETSPEQFSTEHAVTSDHPSETPDVVTASEEPVTTPEQISESEGIHDDLTASETLPEHPSDPIGMANELLTSPEEFPETSPESAEQPTSPESSQASGSDPAGTPESETITDQESESPQPSGSDPAGTPASETPTGTESESSQPSDPAETHESETPTGPESGTSHILPEHPSDPIGMANDLVTSPEGFSETSLAPGSFEQPTSPESSQASGSDPAGTSESETTTGTESESPQPSGSDPAGTSESETTTDTESESSQPSDPAETQESETPTDPESGTSHLLPEHPSDPIGMANDLVTSPEGFSEASLAPGSLEQPTSSESPQPSGSVPEGTLESETTTGPESESSQPSDPAETQESETPTGPESGTSHLLPEHPSDPIGMANDLVTSPEGFSEASLAPGSLEQPTSSESPQASGSDPAGTSESETTTGTESESSQPSDPAETHESETPTGPESGTSHLLPEHPSDPIGMANDLETSPEGFSETSSAPGSFEQPTSPESSPAPESSSEPSITSEAPVTFTSEKATSSAEKIITQESSQSQEQHESSSTSSPEISESSSVPPVELPTSERPELPPGLQNWQQKPFHPADHQHHSTPEIPHIPDDSHYPSTPYDQDYEDEDSVSYGPGTCRYGGKVYLSAQQIPRDDPCDFCFCFRSDIICLQQSCPPPIRGCYQETIKGFCCPRYECHVSMATMVNITTTSTTTTTTVPPHFLSHHYDGSAMKAGCQVKGIAYQVGDRIPSTSGPCLDCRCGANGQMQCDPTICGPQESLLRQVMAASANKKRRR